MSEKIHTFQVALEWIGNLGQDTMAYDAYSREHLVKFQTKQDIVMSSHPDYKGNESFHNPEDLFVSSIASCHMLWYLHLCAASGVLVEEYSDDAEGILEVNPDGSGRFSKITLKPLVVIKNKDKKDLALALHKKAHQMCFLANSCNFPVIHEPSIY